MRKVYLYSNLDLQNLQDLLDAVIVETFLMTVIIDYQASTEWD